MLLAILFSALYQLALAETTTTTEYFKSINGTNEVGKAFLEEAKKLNGVVVLESGLMYQVLEKGTGRYNPKESTECTFHYASTTPSMTEKAYEKHHKKWDAYDSSFKREEKATLAPNGTEIKGWSEAWQLMVEGDKWLLFIPSELGFGDKGSAFTDKIKGGDVLIIYMELIEIKGPKVKSKNAVMCDVKTRAGCDPMELEVLDIWSAADNAAIESELKAIKKKLEGTIKSSERKEVETRKHILKKMAKMIKKGEEL